VNVSLRFTCSAPGFSLVVTTPSGAVPVDISGSTATANVGTAPAATWVIRSGTKSLTGTLVFDRPPNLGVGAFTIPALPVAIVYEPPPDAAQRNFAVYQTANATSTTVTMSFGNDQGTSVPSSFSPLTGLASTLSSGANALSAWGKAFTAGAGGGVTAATDAASVGSEAITGAVAGAVATAAVAGPQLAALAAAVAATATVVQGLLGSTTTTTSSDVDITQSSTLTITKGTTTTFSTGGRGLPNAGGPGKGDMIYVLKGARLLWVAIPAGLSLTLLDWERDALLGVGELQSGGGAPMGLPADTAAALLALDPFVAGGPTASLPANRFVLLTTREMDSAGGREDYLVTSVVANEDTQAETDTSMTVTQDQAGWLAFLGVGVTDSNTTKVSIQNSTSTTTATTATTTASLSLFSGATEPPYDVEVYQDTVFGTFAFRRGTVDDETKPVPVVSSAPPEPPPRPVPAAK
jgi:hypothetical protein